jgi:hypothetical protein
MRAYALSAEPAPARLILLTHTCVSTLARPRDDQAKGRASSKKTAVAHKARRRAEQQKRRAFNAEVKHLRMGSRVGRKGTPFVAGRTYGAEVEGECEMRVDPKWSEFQPLEESVLINVDDVSTCWQSPLCGHHRNVPSNRRPISPSDGPLRPPCRRYCTSGLAETI